MKNSSRLNGWKAISRHFAKSERTIQSWEEERGLPIHRIPGERGSTVYAYVEELDAWMGKRTAVPPDGGERVAEGDARFAPVGIVVVPFECRSASPQSCWQADTLAEELIARFSSLDASLRVASWTTSKSLRDLRDCTGSIARRLGVRYLVEGSIAAASDRLRIDIRVVDAELDQVLFADRFACHAHEVEPFLLGVAESVTGHFALVVDGALVEPRIVGTLDVDAFNQYLDAVRSFSVGGEHALEQALLALKGSLSTDPYFAPALALRGIVLLQQSEFLPYRVDSVDAARATLALLTSTGGAPVTTAFLDAALAIEDDIDWSRAECSLAKALRSLPASVALRGRLYDRRSTRRERPADPVVATEAPPAAAGDGIDTSIRDVMAARQPDVFGNVMRLMAALHAQRRSRSSRFAET